MINLGTLVEIEDLRKVWPHEERDFTPWLADNIDILGETLGMNILVKEIESSVGSFNADIYAINGDDNCKIIIENQLEYSDHDHLGKLITYASGKNAQIVIWLVKGAKEEHKAAIEWLNNHTDDDIGFFLCEIKLFKIGDSYPAPKFEVIEKPNNWVKEMKKTSKTITRTVLPKIKEMISWGVVKPGDTLVAKNMNEEAILLANGYVLYNEEEMSIQEWLKRLLGWKSVETYMFTIHKETGKSLSLIRDEYMSGSYSL